jgi:hypothetical protein
MYVNQNSGGFYFAGAKDRLAKFPAIPVWITGARLAL